MPYRMLVSDLDDTLLDRNGRIADRDLSALRQIRARGIRVVICSGRASLSVAKFVREITEGQADDEFFISFNGAVIERLGFPTPLYQQSIDRTVVDQLVRAAKSRGILAQVYDRDMLFFTQEDERSQAYIALTSLPYRLVSELPSEPSWTPLKVLLNSEPAQLQEFAVAIAASPLAKRCYMTFSKPTYLEFLHPSVNKGNAVTFLAQHLGIPMQDVVAVGDAGNDMEMLAAAGFGIAVANASDVVKRRAKYVTQHEHHDGAVAEAIEKAFGTGGQD